MFQSLFKNFVSNHDLGFGHKRMFWIDLLSLYKIFEAVRHKMECSSIMFTQVLNIIIVKRLIVKVLWFFQFHFRLFKRFVVFTLFFFLHGDLFLDFAIGGDCVKIGWVLFSSGDGWLLDVIIYSFKKFVVLFLDFICKLGLLIWIFLNCGLCFLF